MRAAALVACAGLLAACSRDEAPPRTMAIQPRYEPGPGAKVVTSAAPTAVPIPPLAEAVGATTDASDLLLATVDAQAPMIRVPVYVPPPPVASVAPTPAAPPPDPDIPLRERLRVAEGGCFSSLRAGPGMGPPSHFARVDVTVVPTGSVSRAEVGATDVTDASVLECLRATALAASFSDNDGGPLRTYSIDVRVVAH